jgi:phage shock protein PspC (stress-responsive transcriptional regulator)
MISKEIFMGISETVGVITLVGIVVYFIWMFVYDPKDESDKVLDYNEQEDET